eukprot:jgi/Mesvir1/22818/Mv20081-RA.1
MPRGAFPRMASGISPLNLAAGFLAAIIPLHLSASAFVSAGRPHLTIPPQYSVHIFYYLWYGHPDVDNGTWLHWAHETLPHWNPDVDARFKKHKHQPPGKVHSRYYPDRGCYSSRDPGAVADHMRQLVDAGVRVLVLSWWGPEWRPASADTQGVHTDSALPILFRAAEASGDIKLAFHLEPYAGRTALTVREDIEYLISRYGNSSALLRIDGRPLYYVYDSYLIPASEWAQILSPDGSATLRATPWDGVFIGLLLDTRGADALLAGGFDGGYSYFGSPSVSYASSPANWARLVQWGEDNGKIFIPGVSPGYDDTRIRPWNGQATIPRDNGRVYNRSWEAAVACGAPAVSITSFNEWGEGTQIERAISRAMLEQLAAKWQGNANTGTELPEYLEYEGGPEQYMQLTKWWASQFLKRQGDGTGV